MPKPDLRDKKSAFASAFNAAVELHASAEQDVSEPDALAESVVDLTNALYSARIALQKELKLGGDEGGKASGGGSNSGRSGGSSRSSGGSRSSKGSDGGPTDNQTDYAGDIIGRLKEKGKKVPVKLKDFKDMGYDEAKEALEDLIAIDPKNN